MKRSIYLSALLAIELLYGVDLRLGKGKMDMNVKMMGIFKIDESININTLTIANPHDNIADTNFYFFYDADVYQSDYIETMADMLNIPLDNLPDTPSLPGVPDIPTPELPTLPGVPDISPLQNRNILTDTLGGIEDVPNLITDTTSSVVDKVKDTVANTVENATDTISNAPKKAIDTITKAPQKAVDTIKDEAKKGVKKATDIVDDATKMIPTPFNIKVKGFDMNIGAGYDIYKDKRGYLGVGAATGVSMPYFYMKNKPTATGAILMGMMKSTNTSMTTYKASLSLQGSYMILDGLNVDAVMLYGYQFGKIDNDWFASEVDIDGTNSMVGFSVSYDVGYMVNWASGLTVSAGYTRKNWDVDHTDVKLLGGALGTDLSQKMDANFDTKNFYLGVGYRF